MSDIHAHDGEKAGYVVEGRLNLLFPEYAAAGRGQGWFEMSEGDGFLVPAGEPHQYFNMTDAPVRFLFGVAPTYLSSK
jgi:quercetin dioxygenase-like cupin family protein